MSEAGKAWGLIGGVLVVFGLACLFAYSAGVAAGRESVKPPPVLVSLDPPARGPREALCDDTFDRMRDIIMDEEQAGADQESATRQGGTPAENR